MAMLKCPDCGKLVSDKAVTCVNCGYPIAEFIKENATKAKNLYDEYILKIKADGYNESALIEELINACKKPDESRINAIVAVMSEKSKGNIYTIIYNWAMKLEVSNNEKYDICIYNMKLVYDYLDFELDAMKLRNSYKAFSPKNQQIKGCGIYRAKGEKELKQICGEVICEKFLMQEFGFYFVESTYDQILVLKQNESAFETLVAESKKFIEQMQKTASDFCVEIVVRDDKRKFHFGDLVILNESDSVARQVVDNLEMNRRAINAFTASLKFDGAEHLKKPTSVGTGTVAGAIIGGVPGAIVGNAVAQERNRKYEDAKKFHDEVVKEQKETYDLYINGDIPYKTIYDERVEVGILTFVGVIPFYISNYDLNVLKIQQIIYRNEDVGTRIFEKIKEDKKIKGYRDKQAQVWISKQEYLEDREYAINYIHSISESTTNEMLAELYYNDLQKQEEMATSIPEIKLIIKKCENIKNYEKTNELLLKCNKKIEDINKNNAREMVEKLKKVSTDKESILKLIEALKRLEQYEDVHTLIDEYEKKYSELEQADYIRYQKEDAIRKRNKMKRLIISGIIMTFIVVVGAFFYTYAQNTLIPNDRIKKAEKYIDEAKYVDAINILEGYEDYANVKEVIKYANACKYLYVDDEYVKAETLFLELDTYKRSKDLYDIARVKIVEKLYKDANSSLGDKDYQIAIDKYKLVIESIKDDDCETVLSYKEKAETQINKSMDLINESYYKSGDDAYTNGKYKLAISYYEKVSTVYDDVNEKIENCNECIRQIEKISGRYRITKHIFNGYYQDVTDGSELEYNGVIVDYDYERGHLDIGFIKYGGGTIDYEFEFEKDAETVFTISYVTFTIKGDELIYDAGYGTRFFYVKNN